MATEHFPTTHWSCVLQAGQRPTAVSRAALEQLLKTYWPALRAHLIHRQRLAPEAAEDVLQEFVAAKFIEHNLAGQADPARGRFRSFVLTALDRFATQQSRRARAAKRGGSRPTATLDEDAQPSAENADPGQAFDQAWARTVLDQAVERMRVECQAKERADIWRVFDGRILGPIMRGEPESNYETLVRECGFETPAQASNALMTAKRGFARHLKEVVAEYNDSAADCQLELAELSAALRQ